MQGKTWMIGGGAALALALAVAWAFAPRPLAGRLARITLKEGDAVAAGTPVAVLSAVLPAMLDERTRRELQARVEAAQDNVSRAVSRTARAQVALDQAHNEVRRSEQLVQQGFIAPIKVETDRLATLGAQREVEGAAAERRMAEHELEQTRAALGAVLPSDVGASASEARNPGAFSVRAPSAGRVLRVLQSSEGAVALGTPLIEVGDTQRMEVVTELLTTDALAAKAGSRVIIERWGGPAVLAGRVRSVEPAAFTKVSALGVEEQRVRVVIDITSPQAEWQALGDGYRVSVRIVTLSETKAVQVPVSAVFPLPGSAVQAGAAAASGVDAGVAGSARETAGPAKAPAQFAVFVADGGRARQTAIELGARNGSAAWIRSGITTGQQVIAYPPAAVRDGLRVAARKP